MVAVTITQITPPELEALIEGAIRKTLSAAQKKTEPVTDSGYLTRKQVAERLHIGLPTVHRWMKEGVLHPYHVGGKTLFRAQEVAEALRPVNYGAAIKKKGGRV